MKLFVLSSALLVSLLFSQAASADCIQGYVWREARQNDLVCVTPATRQQAWADNAQTDARRAPGGAYGFDTCLQGFVWREATPDDHVCALPETRDQARYDNAHAGQRE